jgi:PKD repeat protein
MKTKLLCILFILSATFTFSQTWERTFGGSMAEGASFVRQTIDSGFIVAGSTTSFGQGSKDFYIVHIDGLGNLLWTKTFGGIYNDDCRSIIQTFDNGFIACGNSNSFSNSQDAYVVKTDSLGSLLWSKVIGDTLTQTAEEIIQTIDSGYCIVGTEGGASFTRALLIRLNSNGDTLWTKRYGRDILNLGYSLLQTADSGFILSGASYNLVNNYYDVFVVKTNGSGDTLWTRYIADGGHAYGQSISLNGNGYMIGGNGNENFLAISIDAHGNVIWQHEYDKGGLDRCYSMSRSGNDFILAGSTGNFNNTDVLVTKMDNTGNELWARKFGHYQTDEAWSVQSIPTGGFIVAGRTVNPTSEQMYVVRSDCDFFPTVQISVLDTICLGGDTMASTLADTLLTNMYYQWLRDDTAISGANQNSIQASISGWYQLVANDSNSCSNFSNKIFIDFPPPYFNISPVEACIGDIIKMGDWNMPSSYSFYDWNFGDSGTGTGEFVTHVYADTGWYYVVRSVHTSNNNCNIYGDSVHITTTAIPPADFDMEINSTNPLYNTACPGDNVIFIPYAYSYLFVRPPSFDAASYLWDFGDGTTDTTSFPEHQYSQMGMFHVTLTVTNHCGNSASVTDSILIDSTLAAHSYYNWINGQLITDDTVQTCEAVTFKASGGTLYDWDFGDGSTNSTPADSIIHAFATAGTYGVKLVVTNNCGNKDSLTRNVFVVGTCNGIIKSAFTEKLLIVPNPFTNSAEIRIRNNNATSDEFELFVYNISGEIVIRKNVKGNLSKIDRGNLKNGIYFVRMQNKSGNYFSGRFVLE